MVRPKKQQQQKSQESQPQNMDDFNEMDLGASPTDVYSEEEYFFVIPESERNAKQEGSEDQKETKSRKSRK